MSEMDKVFEGSIPTLYDRYLVPLIFERFADDLAERTAARSPSAVLETAAGIGVLTRALAKRLPPSASYAVTDLNQRCCQANANQSPKCETARLSGCELTPLSQGS